MHVAAVVGHVALLASETSVLPLLNSHRLELAAEPLLDHAILRDDKDRIRAANKVPPLMRVSPLASSFPQLQESPFYQDLPLSLFTLHCATATHLCDTLDQ